MLYPLRFKPIYKERIWGGEKLQMFRKDLPKEAQIGESWDIVGFNEHESEVCNGALAGNTLNELLEIYMEELVGDRIYQEYGNTFPLLVKLLDSGDDLSIQVHPNDELAYTRHESYGKSEFWYVISADKEASLINGLTENISPKEYQKSLDEFRFRTYLNNVKTKKGDAFYIPAGKIHSLGKGNLVLEIQQPSDITYRIFDYNRLNKDGRERDLHIEFSMDAIDFENQECERITYESTENHVNCMIDSPHFTINFLKLNRTVERDYVALDSFVILSCVSGSCRIEYDGGAESITIGESLLIPAVLHDIRFIPEGECDIIETYIPPRNEK